MLIDPLPHIRIHHPVLLTVLVVNTVLRPLPRVFGVLYGFEQITVGIIRIRNGVTQVIFHLDQLTQYISGFFFTLTFTINDSGQIIAVSESGCPSLRSFQLMAFRRRPKGSKLW